MFIDNPNRTSFDLQWRMFGVWVRVQPFFWIGSAILGWDWMQLGLQFLAIWIACVFVSILIHEYGHVLVGRIFGSDGYIILHGFGGLAVGSSDLSNRWQRVLVYFAGPLAQLLLWGLLKLIWIPPERISKELLVALFDLDYINWYWALLNLMPIWPLDGGRISRELLEWFSPRWGVRAALALSVGTAATLALNTASALMEGPIIPYVYVGGRYTILLFGLLAVAGIQALYQESQRGRWVQENWHEPETEDEYDSWKR